MLSSSKKLGRAMHVHASWLTHGVCERTKKSPENGIAKTIILTCDVARPLPSRVHGVCEVKTELKMVINCRQNVNM